MYLRDKLGLNCTFLVLFFFFFLNLSIPFYKYICKYETSFSGQGEDGFPKGFFRRFVLGFLMLSMFMTMLVGSCFLVYFFEYEEAYLVKTVSQSENIAIKSWILSKGSIRNVIDFSQTKGCLEKYPETGQKCNGR